LDLGFKTFNGFKNIFIMDLTRYLNKWNRFNLLIVVHTILLRACVICATYKYVQPIKKKKVRFVPHLKMNYNIFLKSFINKMYD